jgi:branched-chain amino acid transport system substrate-binding protein
VKHLFSRKWRIPLLLSCLAAAVVISACGSSSKPTSSSAASPSTTPAASASGKSTWVIGNIGTYSGVNSANFAGGGQTLQAWADYTNAHGGISGHNVKVITEDDAGVPSTSVNDVKQLVADDHVLAIVGMSSGDEALWGKYTTEHNVPVIGGSTPVPDFFQRPNFFPVGTTANESVPDLLLYAKQQLHQTIGAYLYCVEAPVCAQLEPVYAAAYKGIGGTLAYASSFSSTAPSYTSQCLAAQAKHVQDLEIVGPAPVTPKIAQDCQQQGYDPDILLNDVVLTPSLAKSLGSAKVVLGADAFPFNETGTPAAAAFHSALEKYASSVLNPSSFTQIAADDWASGQLFAAAAKAAKLGNNPTAAQLEAGLYQLKNETLGGLTPPLTFHKGKPNSVSCIFIMGISHGAITEPQGLKPFCPAS